MWKGYIKNRRIDIIAKPGMPKTEVVCFDDERRALLVNVHALPDKNKANIEIIRFFTKALKADVRIVSGFTSRKKTLEFSDRK